MSFVTEFIIKNTRHGQICKNLKHPFFLSVANAPATHFLSFSLVKSLAVCIDQERNAVMHKCAFQFHDFHRLLHLKMNEFDLSHKDVENFVTCTQIMRSQYNGYCGYWFDLESNEEWCCGTTSLDA